MCRFRLYVSKHKYDAFDWGMKFFLTFTILRGRTLSAPSQPVSLGHDVLGACKYGKDVILYDVSVEVV